VFGQNNAFLDYIEQVVFPEVQQHTGFPMREAAVAGASYGGLAACYASATRAAVYRRGICLSPSVWMNQNELLRVMTRQSATPPSTFVLL
jgi:predicted alpha/beta superfamily hydrolase